MLVALWHLRYLGLDQIHEVWFQGRSAEACRRRLWSLEQASVVIRVKTLSSKWPSVFRLSSEGYALLREVRHGAFESLKNEVGLQFLPHLLETNAIFLTLAQGEWLWDRLPFTWNGSHHAGLSFSAASNSTDFSKPAWRSRVLRADAVITPKGPGDRVFLELDRATESIDSKTGRTSITRKLEAYQAYLFGRSGGRSWHHAAFGDDRRAVVLFVVPAVEGASRRQRSILNAARALRGLEVPVVRGRDLRGRWCPNAGPRRAAVICVTCCSVGCAAVEHSRAGGRGGRGSVRLLPGGRGRRSRRPGAC
jgi:hypothetical protein